MSMHTHTDMTVCMHTRLCTHTTRGDGVGHQAENRRGRGTGRDGEMGTGKRMVGRHVQLHACHAVAEWVGWVREGKVPSSNRGGQERVQVRERVGRGRSTSVVMGEVRSPRVVGSGGGVH